jgi:hypothetical protein
MDNVIQLRASSSLPSPSESAGEMRTWLLGSAMSTLQALARIASQHPGLEDVEESFQAVAAVWAEH